MMLRTEYITAVKQPTVVPVRDISHKTALWTATVASLISLWIRSGIPLIAVPDAYHDDAFFARTANYLLAGQWLGPYDKMTLAKGMFYPLFVAAASAASIPVKIAEQLAYLSAAGIVSFVASRASQRRWFGVLMFVGLAFNPVFWHHWLDRVSREGLYTALSFGLFGLIVLISFPELHRNHRSTVLGLSFGLAWAAFWLTREESIWLLPTCIIPIAVGVAYRVISWRKDSGSSPGGRYLIQQLRPVVTPLALGTVAFLFGVGSVAGINWHYYGVFRTNEFRSGGFVRAYGALARIEGGHFRRFVPIPLHARQKAYEVSGAARQLSGSLEVGQAHDWSNYGCAFHPIPPPCDQQAWIIWALRDAAEQAGHYRSAAETDAFYSAIANDINSACEEGRIQCSAQRDTFTPPFHWEYVGETAQAAKPIAKLIFDMGNGEVGAVPSVGSAQGLAKFADLTDEYVSPPVGGVTADVPLGRVDGWVAARSDVPTLEVIANTKRENKNWIRTVAAPDVVAVHPDLKSVRFTLTSDCPVLDCDLAIHLSTGNVLVPFQKLLTRGAPIDTPNVILFMDVQTATEGQAVSERRRAFQMRIAHRIGTVYAKCTRTLTVLAAIGLLLAIVRFRVAQPSLPLVVLAIGSIAAVASRILLLSYIAATSFKSDFLHYCSPASPFLIVFVVSGLYLGCSSVLNKESRPKMTGT